MRVVSNLVGGIGSSGTGNIGDVLTKVGALSHEFEWRSIADLMSGGLSNGTSSVSIPNAHEDILYNVGAGFVHRFKISSVDVGTWNDTSFSLSTAISSVSGEVGSEVSTARATNLAFAASVSELSVNRVASTAFNFLTCISEAGTTPDTKMKIDGEGRIHTDQPVLVSGADYAEMFEWEDGNTFDEDRVGYTVTLLDGGKIRVSVDADDTNRILGVVSGNPTMVGNASPLGWDGKYLRDDFGRITGPNPEFDPEQEYTPRAYRKEYAVVGVIGQIPVRNGQIIKSNWVPLFRVSDSVTMYWVR